MFSKRKELVYEVFGYRQKWSSFEGLLSFTWAYDVRNVLLISSVFYDGAMNFK